MLVRHIIVDVVLACILLLFNEADTLTFVDIQVTVCDYVEVFERSRSKSSPLEKPRSKLANPVELTGFDRG